MSAEFPLLAKALATEPEPEPMARRILDGALEQFSDTGLTRTTMDDVARRAGLSRVTIYRRFESKQALIEAVLVRECRRCLAALDAAVGELATVEERIVTGFAFALRFAREHPLVGGLLRIEPEVILPYLTVSSGMALGLVREYLATRLLRGPGSGSLSEADVRPIAELMARITVSFVIGEHSCIPLRTDEQIRAFAQRYLVPLVSGG